MSIEKNYNNIIKATGLLGSMQFINIIISIIKSKVIAILLGTSGIGIIGLYTNTLNIISSISNLGITSSSVKAISFAKTNNSHLDLIKILSIIKKLFLITSYLGALILFILSWKLSYLLFNNNLYTVHFMILSLAILFQNLHAGNLAILQGLHNLKDLARANILSSLITLILSSLFYYYFKIEGIVPAFIFSAFFVYLNSLFFIKKNQIKTFGFRIKEVLVNGIEVIKLGSIIMLTNFLLLGVYYVLQLYILRNGGLEHLGLYLAAMSIINGYIGIIFTTLQTDFLPRLSSLSDKQAIFDLVNHQAEIVILLLGPLLVILMFILPFIIKILYSSSFLPVVSLLNWSIMGVLFKSSYWTLGTMLIATGDYKPFIILEVIIDSIIISVNIILYSFLELEGIGIAYLICNIIGLVMHLILFYWRYDFSFDKSFRVIFIIQFLLVFISFLITFIYGYHTSYYFSIPIIIMSIYYSITELKKRINFKSFLYYR